jgi:hypothetical protein
VVHGADIARNCWVDCRKPSQVGEGVSYFIGSVSSSFSLAIGSDLNPGQVEKSPAHPPFFFFLGEVSSQHTVQPYIC